MSLLRNCSSLAWLLALLFYAAAAADDQRNTLVSQKLLLLDSLLESPRIQQARQNGNADTSSRIAQAIALRDEARRLLAAGDAEAAVKAADESLRTASAAAASVRAPLLAPGLQQNQNADLLQQTQGYQAAIAEVLKKQGKPQDQRQARIAELIDKANADTAAGRHGDANRKLGEAYRLAVGLLSELRAGETVVLDLKFDTPADEYAYEQKRHRSHEMLVEMMVQEGRADSNRVRFDESVEAGRQLRLKAEQLAGAGDYQDAVRQLEEATAQLLRALQLAGLPVF